MVATLWALPFGVCASVSEVYVYTQTHTRAVSNDQMDNPLA